MKVLVAGLSVQSSAAVELIIGSVFLGATVVQHPRGPGCTTLALASDAGQCDFCVIDLGGLGWGVRTPEREAALQDSVLGERPAIVLLPAGDSDWIASAVLKDRAQPRIGLLQPASMTSLQEALLLLRRSGPSSWAPLTADTRRAVSRSTAAPVATIRGSESASGWRGPVKDAQLAVAAPPPAEQLRMGRRSAFAPQAATGVAGAGVATPPESSERGAAADGASAPLLPAAFKLGGADRSALAAACPKLRDKAFLNLVLDRLALGTACEIRIGSRAGIVLCPERNWAAANLSVALRKRIAHHRLMLDIIETRPLSPLEAARVARRLYGRRRDGRRALDTFVFSFVLALLGEDPPEVDGSFTFRLRRFPDFTRLQPVDDLHLQLALYCLHRSLTAGELRAAFSRHDPRQISLFIVCALLSGSASISLPGPSDGVTPSKTERKTTARTGFIRSLLAKLF